MLTLNEMIANQVYMSSDCLSQVSLSAFCVHSNYCDDEAKNVMTDLTN